MSTARIADLTVDDVVYLPIAADGTTQGPITVEWVREDRDGTLCVGWHAGGEDHILCLPLHLSVLGAVLVPPLRRQDRRHRPTVARRRYGARLAS